MEAGDRGPSSVVVVAMVGNGTVNVWQCVVVWWCVAPKNVVP